MKGRVETGNGVRGGKASILLLSCFNMLFPKGFLVFRVNALFRTQKNDKPKKKSTFNIKHQLLGRMFSCFNGIKDGRIEHKMSIL